MVLFLFFLFEKFLFLSFQNGMNIHTWYFGTLILTRIDIFRGFSLRKKNGSFSFLPLWKILIFIVSKWYEYSYLVFWNVDFNSNRVNIDIFRGFSLRKKKWFFFFSSSLKNSHFCRSKMVWIWTRVACSRVSPVSRRWNRGATKWSAIN